MFLYPALEHHAVCDLIATYKELSRQVIIRLQSKNFGMSRAL